MATALDIRTPETRNLTRLFRAATPEAVQAGIDWYVDAHRIASVFATQYDVSVAQAAGVIAAVSPLQSWGANVNLAGRILAAGGLTAGYLSAGLKKADRILAGEDIEKVLNGSKIVNFYKGIVSEGREGVCIDRHSWSASVNFRYEGGVIPSLSAKRYAAAVEAHVRAAKILSRELDTEITPAQVQAVTWGVWRSKFWSAGAFDSHDAI